jgi:tRNA nucleotidyltransferase (CCA-adding enzyme)
MAAGWEHFEHGADVGVRGIGDTPAQAFEQAALAMTAVITDPAAVRPSQSVEIRCENDDLELLLADWLNALVFEMATRHLLFAAFTVKLEGAVLIGLARGEPVDVLRHHPAVEVKGATLTELKVAQGSDGKWIAQCVVDV